MESISARLEACLTSNMIHFDTPEQKNYVTELFNLTINAPGPEDINGKIDNFIKLIQGDPETEKLELQISFTFNTVLNTSKNVPIPRQSVKDKPPEKTPAKTGTINEPTNKPNLEIEIKTIQNDFFSHLDKDPNLKNGTKENITYIKESFNNLFISQNTNLSLKDYRVARGQFTKSIRIRLTEKEVSIVNKMLVDCHTRYTDNKLKSVKTASQNTTSSTTTTPSTPGSTTPTVPLRSTATPTQPGNRVTPDQKRSSNIQLSKARTPQRPKTPAPIAQPKTPAPTVRPGVPHPTGQPGRPAPTAQHGMPTPTTQSEIPAPIGQRGRTESTRRDPTLIEGNSSQYNIHGDQGKSACTVIAMVAACRLMDVPNFSGITSDVLDSFLDSGIRLFNKAKIKEHTDMDQIARLHLIPEGYTTFKDSYGGTINPTPTSDAFKNFSTTLDDVINEQNSQFPFAAVITKPPETISIIVKSNKEFWLFDSHGQKAFVKQYSSKESFLKAIQERFPFVEEIDDPEQDYLINNFGLTVLKKTS